MEELLVVRRQLLDYVRRVLCSEGYEVPEKCAVHEALLKHTADEDSQDTIVTLNYDLVVDLTLHSMSEGIKTTPLSRMYGLLAPVPGSLLASARPALRGPRGGLLLKLHGAVDWSHCANALCRNHRYIYSGWLGLKQEPVQAGEVCSGCGTDFEWVLVPPTMKKSFEVFPRLSLIWRLAHEELKVADKVVFFGVSMAPSDYYLHWLIRSSLVYRDPKPEVIVINPCAKAVKTTRQLTGVDPQRYASVEEYLDARDS